MSTIHASNYGDGTAAVPASTVLRGAAKSWINFNGTGVIATRNSLNVSSITDGGTGDYKVNFTNAFTADDYIPTVLTINDGVADSYRITVIPGDMLAGSFRYRQSGGAAGDFKIAGCSIHGDLA